MRIQNKPNTDGIEIPDEDSSDQQFEDVEFEEASSDPSQVAGASSETE